MEDKIIEQKESLELIEKMIKSAQKEFNPYAGWHLVVWGYAVFFSAMLVAIFFDYFPNGMANIFWLLIPLVGMTLSFFIHRKEERLLLKGYIHRMIRSLSFVINIAIFTVMMGTFFVGLPIIPIILLLNGVHCATVGLVMQYRLLTIMGIVGIVYSMIFYLIPYGVLQIYLFGFYYIFLMSIPGHYLIYLNKKNRA